MGKAYGCSKASHMAVQVPKPTTQLCAIRATPSQIIHLPVKTARPTYGSCTKISCTKLGTPAKDLFWAQVFPASDIKWPVHLTREDKVYTHTWIVSTLRNHCTSKSSEYSFNPFVAPNGGIATIKLLLLTLEASSCLNEEKNSSGTRGEDEVQLIGKLRKFLHPYTFDPFHCSS